MNWPYIIFNFSVFIILSIVFYFVAAALKLKDVPNERSSHQNIVVRGGGIIFPLAVFVYYFLGLYFKQMIWLNGPFLYGLFGVAVISLLDDILNISFKIRLPIHILAGYAIIYSLLLSSPGVLGARPIPIALILCLIIVFYMNVFNFMDGINGITGLTALSIFLPIFWYINRSGDAGVDNRLVLTLVISVVVFLLFNFRKQPLFFAGDVGSISIGYIIVYVLLTLGLNSGNRMFALFPALYVVDGLGTLLYRLSKQENLTQPHRLHIYQLLANEAGWRHSKVALLYGVLQIVINLILVKFGFQLNWVQIAFVYFVLFIVYALVHNKLVKKYTI